MHILTMNENQRIDLQRGARIKYVRTEILRLRSQEKFAELLTREGTPVTRGAVGNWELGQNIGIDSMTAICKVAGVNLDWLAYNKGAPEGDIDEGQAPEPANAVLTGDVAQKGPKIPLYGAAVGGEDGEFELNGNLLDHIFAPRSLSGIPEAYGVQVVGESMYPRYEDGETVYVNPKRRPVKGDYVVAEIAKDEHGGKLAYIKKLVRHTQLELVLEQFNPPKQLRFNGSQVATVHYVLKNGE
jgi:phage repressor protein C with HTH and peptisase S24 domain